MAVSGDLSLDTDHLCGMSAALSRDDFIRWSANAQPLPLPPHRTPRSGIPLSTVDEHTLLNAPPQLIAHIQRTAAQGGLQVVSPRQTPMSAMMVRTVGGQRQVGDHVVGSIADQSAEWPTLDDEDLSELLPDEPLPTRSADEVKEVKTRTVSLTSAEHLLSDPILACLVRGRAVIDVLRREDVAGGADEFAELLAKAWGIGTEDIEDLDAFTIGVDGPLLRHAIQADDVYATSYAPIHVRRCVSVGASEANRNYLAEDSAMDWKRMRVHCEAVYIMTCYLEGYPIKYITAFPAPGDPGAPSNRDNVMCFQPAACSAWTFSPITFSIMPKGDLSRVTAACIPSDVLVALSRYMRIVRPVSHLMSMGHTPSARRSRMVAATAAGGETLSEFYQSIIVRVSLGAARGKVAAAAVRNVIFSTMEDAPMHERLRVVRYIQIAEREVLAQLGLREVPDRVIEKLADRFLKLGSMIRSKVAGEASRRGHTVEEWWLDIMSQAPDRYAAMTEGTKGWAMAGMWLMFRQPTDRWRKLGTAIKYSTLREASVNSVAAMSLPAALGSVERLVTAARGAAKQISSAFAGFYQGVADVGLAVADVADDMSMHRTAATLREGSYMWVLRARCLRGTNVDVFDPDSKSANPLHFVVKAQPADLVIAPAPYRAFDAYKSHIEKSDVVKPAFKYHLNREHIGPISKVFSDYRVSSAVCTESTVTKYLVKPWRLGEDMERAWGELKQDMYRVAREYGAHTRSRTPSPVRKKLKEVAREDICTAVEALPAGQVDYYAASAGMTPDEVDWAENLLAELGELYEDEYMGKLYRDTGDLRAQLVALESERGTAEGRDSELVG